MTEFDANEQRAAEDIVRKLCKNGKLMEFQEGEDFIKVIVYEDSQEEDNDTLSADEGEGQTSYGRKIIQKNTSAAVQFPVPVSKMNSQNGVLREKLSTLMLNLTSALLVLFQPV